MLKVNCDGEVASCFVFWSRKLLRMLLYQINNAINCNINTCC